MSAPVGLACPECGAAPAFVFGGGTQAFCSNVECAVLTWDPTKTREELAAGSRTIDMPWTSDDAPDPD